MPRLSDSMEEGTILKWLVSEGDEVKRGQEIVEIETDKANMTYEADTDGALIEIVAEEGDTLPIGEVIARIGEPGESGGSDQVAGGRDEDADEDEESEEEPAAEEAEQADESEQDEQAEQGEESEQAEEPEPVPAAESEQADEPEQAEAATATKEAEPAGAPEPSGDGDGRVKASPVARRMARDLGVELARLEGSGPGGRIVKADVEAAAKGDGAEPEPAAAEAPEAPAEERPPVERAPERRREEVGVKGEAEVVDLTRLQQTVSRRMAESKATAPDFSLSLTVDMTKAVELRARLKEVAEVTPSFNDMVVKASAMALREHPRVNGAYRDGKFELYERVNIGVAVAAQDALVVPTVF